jgi:hypothetical protein
MNTNNDGISENILRKINDMFTEEVGPVAMFLCQEAQAKWEEELENKGQKPALRHIPSYVHRLSLEIEDKGKRKAFLDAVFRIEVLAMFR